MSEKKRYEEPKVIYEQKVEITGGGCATQPGNTSCENAGYVLTQQNS